MQNEWYKQLLAAIPLRHSVRTSLPEQLPNEMPEQIGKFFDNLATPFDHNTSFQVFEAKPGKSYITTA